MIEVTRVVGESVDLRTGEGAGKFLVLSNGRKEIHIPVSENSAASVITLWAEDMRSGNGELAPPTPEEDAVSVSQLSKHAEVLALNEERREVLRRTADGEEVHTTFQPESDEEEELEVGEQYADPATGSGSI